MKIFSWQLYGNPRDIVGVIGETAFSLKSPLFVFPGEELFKFEKDMIDYDELRLVRTKDAVVEVMEPQGDGWSMRIARLGVFRPLAWGRAAKGAGVQTEVVAYLDFAPSAFERQPNTLLVYEAASQSGFLDAWLKTLNVAFERHGYLRYTTDFKMEHVTTEFSDVSAENLNLVRELKELSTQLTAFAELREKVKTLEHEATKNKAKREELEALRQQMFPPSYQLPTGTLSVQEERLNALLQTQRIYYRNLNELEKRSAYYGLNIPIDVVNQIEFFKTKVGEIEREITALQQAEK